MQLWIIDTFLWDKWIILLFFDNWLQTSIKEFTAAIQEFLCMSESHIEKQNIYPDSIAIVKPNLFNVFFCLFDT